MLGALAVVGALVVGYYLIGVVAILFWILVACGAIYLAVLLFGPDRSKP